MAVNQLQPKMETWTGIDHVKVVGAKRLLVRLRISGVSLSKLNLDVKRVDELLAKMDLHFTPSKNDPWVRERIINTSRQTIGVDTLGDLIVSTDTAGSTVRLKDVAQFELGTQESLREAQYLAKPVVALAIYRKTGSYPIGFVLSLVRQFGGLQALLPPDVKIEMVEPAALSIKAAAGSVPPHIPKSLNRLAAN